MIGTVEDRSDDETCGWCPVCGEPLSGITTGLRGFCELHGWQNVAFGDPERIRRYARPTNSPNGGMMEQLIYDSRGALVAVGARVLDKHGHEYGTITALTPLDVDVNEHGRPHAIGPCVVVDYDDGCQERWLASWNATGPWDDYRTDYTCDDVTVLL